MSDIDWIRSLVPYSPSQGLDPSRHQSARYEVNKTRQLTRQQTTRLFQDSDPHPNQPSTWNVRSLQRMLEVMNEPGGVADTPLEAQYRQHLYELAASREPYVRVPPQIRWFCLGDLAFRGYIPVSNYTPGPTGQPMMPTYQGIKMLLAKLSE